MSTCNSILKVIIVHEDPSSHHQAADVLKRVAARLGTEAEMEGQVWQTDGNVWKFELLQNPELWEQAVARTVEADMIIISAGGNTELPVCVRNWIESALPRKQGESAALVALLDHGMEPRSATSHPGNYLRDLAERCGVDFFCNTTDDRSQSIRSVEPTFSTFEDDSAFLEEALPYDSARRGWGINE